LTGLEVSERCGLLVDGKSDSNFEVVLSELGAKVRLRFCEAVFGAPASQNLGIKFTNFFPGLEVAAGEAVAFCSAKTDRITLPGAFDFEVEVRDFRKGFLVFETVSGRALVLANSLSTFRLLFLAARDATISCMPAT
jgi:hypothetical protein